VCHVGIVNFLRFFKSLKVLYLVFPLCKANLKELGAGDIYPRPQELRKLVFHPRHIGQYPLDTFRAFQGKLASPI
jgi:hypothetical protein